ncbi:hypothetical protein HDV03_002006 [Kappamyces sp. JEL0829]|nr:hypothetical protein HDV03_002006 [Kappamyces sp. JEL0829]
MRAQIANSLYPISISIPLPSQLTFDQVYDLIVGRLLHARTCIYNADLEKSYKVFMQGLYIAQMSGMLNVPANPDQLPKSEHGRIEIQLSVINALLKLDMILAFIKGSEFVMDDSNYTLNLRLQDMTYRKTAQVRQIQHTQGTYIVNDFGFIYEGSRLKTLQSTIFFVKFLRHCISWNFKSSSTFADRISTHVQILDVMNKNADDSYKLLIPSIWKTPVNLLILIHTGNVTNRTHLFCAQKNGPEYYTSADIIYGCIHTVARTCYFFQILGSLQNEIREPFSEHLLPPSLGTGTCERAVNWNVDGITKYIPENIVDTSPLKYYTLDEQARIYIENLSANFPEPQRLCPESDLNNHLLRLGLLFFPEHGFNYGLCHLGEQGGFPQFRAACIHHGVYLSRHPALFHGMPSSSKTMRAQIANSLFPIATSFSLPSQPSFDQVYDFIVGRLLHSRTCMYNADLEKSYKVFMQGLYIAQMSGMLND